MNDLERFASENEGGLIYKWRHYFEIYDRHFSRYRGAAVNVLEIGVFHGGSLQMWKDYFGPRATIHGVDINPNSMLLEEERVKILIGDQADKSFLRRLVADLPRIDIPIDDGGHTMKQQKNTFEVMFPHIADDGVYVCEDLHTSYWREYGGGYRRRGSFIERSKGLIDSLNAWHSRSGRLAVSDLTKSMHGLHFYDSMLVIEKRRMEPPSEVRTGVERVEPHHRYGAAGRAFRRLPDSSYVKRSLKRLRRVVRKLWP